MISGKQLHGLKVLDKNGIVLGVVQDLLADKQSGIIKGFIINLPGFISTLAFLSGQGCPQYGSIWDDCCRQKLS